MHRRAGETAFMGLCDGAVRKAPRCSRRRGGRAAPPDSSKVGDIVTPLLHPGRAPRSSAIPIARPRSGRGVLKVVQRRVAGTGDHGGSRFSFPGAAPIASIRRSRLCEKTGRDQDPAGGKAGALGARHRGTGCPRPARPASTISSNSGGRCSTQPQRPVTPEPGEWPDRVKAQPDQRRARHGKTRHYWLPATCAAIITGLILCLFRVVMPDRHFRLDLSACRTDDIVKAR